MEMKQMMALLEALGMMDVDFTDVKLTNWGTIDVDGAEYIVLDEEIVQERVAEHIRESAAYFNPNFLSDMTCLPVVVFESLTEQHEAVLAIIEKTCGFDYFVQKAIEMDGAGHFIATYDGDEYDLGNGYYAYRIG